MSLHIVTVHDVDSWQPYLQFIVEVPEDAAAAEFVNSIREQAREHFEKVRDYLPSEDFDDYKFDVFPVTSLGDDPSAYGDVLGEWVAHDLRKMYDSIGLSPEEI